MNYNKALRLAIDALNGRLRSLATEANLHDLYHANHHAAIVASQKRKEIQEAIKTLVTHDFCGYEICLICGGLVSYDQREAHFLECQAVFLNREIPPT